MHRPPDHARRVLAENRRRYDQLVDIARRHAERGDVERVLRSATSAATYGWLAPMGLLSDPDLERLVIDAVRGETPPRVDGGRDAGRVLHVLSEAYGTGGHTRLAWRWMERDPRASDVALTNHRGVVPEPLMAAARASGSRLYDLRASSSDLTTRAVELRSLMNRADLVVLHVHPNDVVALAAVNLPGPRPPVIYENHADHGFWLGVGAADLVSDLRTGAHRLCTDLRGIAPHRVGLLPLPIETPAATTSPDELRRQLGIAPDAVVAVTVAADFKVAPTWGRGMDELLGRALAWSPQLTVVLAGPPASGPWERLAKAYPRRVLALGPVADPGPYYALADVYLDSYPTRAVTSVLEAALLGVPVLTIADISADHPAHIWQADSPGMEGLPRVTTREQYGIALRRLVTDPERRVREGAAVQESVRRAHHGPEWSAALERLYAKARELTACDIDEIPERIEDVGYGGYLLGYTPSQTESPDVASSAWALGELFDDGMRADQVAVSRRDAGRFTVRVDRGWQDAGAWTTRLLTLAAAHPQLVVSLPFVPGDDATGTLSVARLTELLSGVGRTTEDCGDVRLESDVPLRVGAPAFERLPLVTEVLDWLECLLASPCWDSPAVTAQSSAAG